MRRRERFLGSGAKLGLGENGKGENGAFEFVGAFFTGIIAPPATCHRLVSGG